VWARGLNGFSFIVFLINYLINIIIIINII